MIRRVAVLCALCGCGSDAPMLLDDPFAPFPERISGLGLYPNVSDPSITSDLAIGYTTRFPFHSNGAEKDRFVVTPSPIDVGARALWQFAEGTLVFKTFGFGAPTETRVLRLAADASWEFAAYRWRADGSDGDLLDLVAPDPVTVTADGATFDHLIPSRLDCRTCHERDSGPMLGLDELGLGATGLDAFAAAGLLAGEIVDPVEIDAPTTLERDVLGYLEGNCAYCHDGKTGPTSAFDLRHPAALASLICQPTDETQTAPGFRIVPGDPDASIMFLAVSGETDDPEVKPMPPLGVQHRDAAGTELLREWISTLPGGCP